MASLVADTNRTRRELIAELAYPAPTQGLKII